jgi:hypothetical protein
MVHALKNIAIRLWISAAAGGIFTLGLLAILGSPLDTTFNLVVAAVVTSLAFFGFGWLFNRIATLRLEDYLMEATSRERTARVGEAAEAFRKAITLFDSFLVSPLFRRRVGRNLAGRIARFHIARAVHYPEEVAFVTSYLWEQPDDEEIAEYWLQHTPLGENADPDHLALADRIAAATPGNLAIQGLVAQIYLAKRRTDYTALQTYKRLLQESDHIQALTIPGIADLFVREGRADEWALEIYLKAFDLNPERTEYLKGLAACLDRIRETERNEPLIAASRKALRGIDTDTMRQWQVEFLGEAALAVSGKPGLAAAILRYSAVLPKSLFHGILLTLKAAASILGRLGETVSGTWRESARLRLVAKWAIVVAFAAVVLASGISTIKYIRETKESPESAAAPVKTPQMATSGRYTVQAASFRNRDQAIRFATQIAGRGYPAYWGESRSSDEDIWYYVRISRFETKLEAKEYGEKLKSEDIIDDFYVTVYKAPASVQD